MATNKVDFLVPSTTREPTPIIWGDCPVADIQENPSVGWHLYDDFDDFPLIGTQTTQIGFGKYKVFATTSATVVPVSTINSVVQPHTSLKAGVVVSTAAVISPAYGNARMSGSAADGGKLWFEARLAIQSVSATTQGFFLGMGEVEGFTYATGVPINGGAATITNGGSMIGFQSIETGPLAINTVVSDRATSFTSIQAGTSGTQPGSFGATAYTFTKLGMVYDPSRSADCLKFYQDGVQFTTMYTNANIVATTNLKANALAMMLAVIGTGTGGVYMQWWRSAQLYA